jgi:hypothetical protein
MLSINENEIRSLVGRIHGTPGRLLFVTAGAGTQALAWLLGVSGATRTLLEALIPYDESSFDDFLGRKPTKYVATRTAGLLAGRAVVRARNLYQGDEPVIGLACSATIITDRPKKGQHRAHIAVWTSKRVDKCAIWLHKGMRDRQGEEEMVSLLVLNALARAYGIDSELPLPLIEGDRFTRDCLDIDGGIRKVLDGRRGWFGVRDDGRQFSVQNPPKALLSGAFNPLHEGHLGLAETASQILGQEVVFELAAVNAEKSVLSAEECRHRLLQFAGGSVALVSRAPLFSQKAELYPGVVFVVGIDTAQRVLQPRFYDGRYDGMIAALKRIEACGCSFLVAGRADDDGTYQRAGELAVPDEFAGMFRAIPGEQFRIDLSSTELRSGDG